MTEQELKEKSMKYVNVAQDTCPGSPINFNLANVTLLASALMISDAMLEIAETLKPAIDLPKES